MDALLRPPIAFAHRGGRADARENTLEAFALALELGATGLESDVWLTADGVPVLDHDGIVRAGPRRRRIASLRQDELPPHIPTLSELYDSCGTDYELSLDVKDPEAAAPVIAIAAAAGCASRLWLCHPDWKQVAEWRAVSPDVRLVDSTRIRKIKEGPERRAASLAEAGIDAINMHHTDWTGGLTTLFHRFDRYAFAWDAQFERILVTMMAIGVDAVYSDHVALMMDVVEQSRR